MDNAITRPKVPIQVGYICPLRPSGDVCLVYDHDLLLGIECIQVIMLTGDKRGVKTYVLRREIVRSRTPERSDIDDYRLPELLSPKELLNLSSKFNLSLQ